MSDSDESSFDLELDSDSGISSDDEKIQSPQVTINKVAEKKGKVAAATKSSSISAAKGEVNGAVLKKPKLEHGSNAASQHVTPTPSLQPSSTSVSVPVPSAAGVDITRGPPVTTEASAKKLIMLYLKIQNRPFSAIQIFDNLHKRVPKATVERVLTTLSTLDGNSGSDQTEIRCKEFGKAKIYFYNQDKVAGSSSKADLDALDAELKGKGKLRDDAVRTEKALKVRVQSLEAEPSDTTLDRYDSQWVPQLYVLSTQTPVFYH